MHPGQHPGQVLVVDRCGIHIQAVLERGIGSIQHVQHRMPATTGLVSLASIGLGGAVAIVGGGTGTPASVIAVVAVRPGATPAGVALARDVCVEAAGGFTFEHVIQFK